VLSLPGGAAEGDALAELWRAGALCDVALRAGDDACAPPLLCHRVVLASASPFFRCAPSCLAPWREAKP
jgi:hypothetical protein